MNDQVLGNSYFESRNSCCEINKIRLRKSWREKLRLSEEREIQLENNFKSIHFEIQRKIAERRVQN